jgi:hypothetical protein
LCDYLLYISKLKPCVIPQNPTASLIFALDTITAMKLYHIFTINTHQPLMMSGEAIVYSLLTNRVLPRKFFKQGATKEIERQYLPYKLLGQELENFLGTLMIYLKT